LHETERLPGLDSPGSKQRTLPARQPGPAKLIEMALPSWVLGGICGSVAAKKRGCGLNTKLGGRVRAPEAKPRALGALPQAGPRGKPAEIP
jgi:hypothetical protein